MGFEVRYSFHEKKADGPGYDESAVKSMTKRVGKADEDTPREKVVASIMSQMARRDIWIKEVEVFEFTRRKLKFKDVRGGVSLDGTKYLFDQVGTHATLQGGFDDDTPRPMTQAQLPPGVQPHELIHAGQYQPAPQPMMPQAPQPVLADPRLAPSRALPKGGSLASAGGMQFSGGDKIAPRVQFEQVQKAAPGRPLRMEKFDPDQYQEAKLRGAVQLTKGRTYPVMSEMGSIYTVKDDRGRDITISNEYFVAQGGGLIGPREFTEDSVRRDDAPKLSYQGAYFDEQRDPSEVMQQNYMLESKAAAQLQSFDVNQVRQQLARQGRY